MPNSLCFMVAKLRLGREEQRHLSFLTILVSLSFAERWRHQSRCNRSFAIRTFQHEFLYLVDRATPDPLHQLVPYIGARKYCCLIKKMRSILLLHVHERPSSLPALPRGVGRNILVTTTGSRWGGTKNTRKIDVDMDTAQLHCLMAFWFDKCNSDFFIDPPLWKLCVASKRHVLQNKIPLKEKFHFFNHFY